MFSWDEWSTISKSDNEFWSSFTMKMIIEIKKTFIKKYLIVIDEMIYTTMRKNTSKSVRNVKCEIQSKKKKHFILFEWRFYEKRLRWISFTCHRTKKSIMFRFSHSEIIFLRYYHDNIRSFFHIILIVYIEYIDSIEFFENNSSFRHHIIVSKDFLLQLIASIYHQSNFSDCSSVLSYQSYWHQNWSESEICW
jgi:hypothetical protein